MKLPHSRLLALLSLGVALALAGCTEGGDGDAQEVTNDDGEQIGCGNEPAGEPDPGGDSLTTGDEQQNEVDQPPGC